MGALRLPLEHRTPYAMRHFFISEAIAAGIPSYEVARLAGTSVTQIEATYAHLFGEHLERSRAAWRRSILRRMGANRARPTLRLALLRPTPKHQFLQPLPHNRGARIRTGDL
jgi:hypothetical protein